MAEIAVLLTEMTCESPKSKFLLKNIAAFLPNNMAVLTKIAPGEEGWEIGMRAHFTRRNTFIILTNFIY